MVAATDPNWLYSTTAQSAAALVAIIGGLVASRLIALAGERQVLQRQLNDVAGEIGVLKRQHDAVRGEARDYAFGMFRREFVSEYVKGRGALPAGVEQGRPFRGSTEEEHARWHERVAGEVSEAFRSLESRRPVPTFELAQQLGLVDTLGEDVVELVCGNLQRQAEREELEARKRAARAQPKGRGLIGMSALEAVAGLGQAGPGFDPLMFQPPNPGAMERQNERIRDADHLDAEIERLAAKQELAQENLATVARPADVGRGLWALSLFAILGIGLPLVLMAFRPVPSGAGVRALVVGAFALGLGLVIGFLRSQWRALRAE